MIQGPVARHFEGTEVGDHTISAPQAIAAFDNLLRKQFNGAFSRKMLQAPLLSFAQGTLIESTEDGERHRLDARFRWSVSAPARTAPNDRTTGAARFRSTPLNALEEFQDRHR
jgi:hypothetical protein